MTRATRRGFLIGLGATAAAPFLPKYIPAHIAPPPLPKTVIHFTVYGVEHGRWSAIGGNIQEVARSKSEPLNFAMNILDGKYDSDGELLPGNYSAEIIDVQPSKKAT